MAPQIPPGSFNNLNRTSNINKNRGVIFPSIKNKPNPANTTFTTDQLFGAIKDVKVRDTSLRFSSIDFVGLYWKNISTVAIYFVGLYWKNITTVTIDFVGLYWKNILI